MRSRRRCRCLPMHTPSARTGGDAIRCRRSGASGAVRMLRRGAALPAGRRRFGLPHRLAPCGKARPATRRAAPPDPWLCRAIGERRPPAHRGVGPGQIFGRSNWFISPARELKWLADCPAEEQFAHVTAESAGETLFVRCEQQILRKLPQTGVVGFAIGVYHVPLAQVSPRNGAWRRRRLRSFPGRRRGERSAPFYTAQLTAFTLGPKGKTEHER